jgi:cystathionine beta-lyase/cystathionine gamma-synthase
MWPRAIRRTGKAIYDFAVTVGLTPSPFDCWLAERGLYSFHLRYDRAEAERGAACRPSGRAAPV